MFDRSMNFALGEEIDALREMVHRFAQERIAPRAAEIDASNEFPMELWRELGELGLLGITVEEELGGSGMGYLAHCVAIEEISRASASVGLSYGAHSNLCVNQIRRNGTEEQKAKYLPKLISGEHVGSLAMSESGAGSDVVSMKLRAEKRNDRFILNGTKMWITSSPICHLALVWAKVDDGGPESIRGFIVERGMDGFETPTIHGKMSLRASPTGEIVCSDVRVPAANMLPGVEGLKGPLSCLTTARFGIAYGALGAARACLDSAIDYACERVQFGQPVASKQLIQKQLADMATDIATGQLTWLHFARLKDKQGKITPVQVSMCKRNNVRVALEVARKARSILGGNGILLEYPAIRHMLNLESVYTYEGTNEVHELILGHALTGMNAF